MFTFDGHMPSLHGSKFIDWVVGISCNGLEDHVLGHVWCEMLPKMLKCILLINQAMSTGIKLASMLKPR